MPDNHMINNNVMNKDLPYPNQKNQVRVIAVSSGKGGVGKTSVAVNLAMAIAQMGKKTLLMDADLGLANVDILLGIRTNRNLAHVIRGECPLDDAIVTGPAGLRILPAASGIKEMANLSIPELGGLIRSFSGICQDLDFLIVDTASGISDSVLTFARACQEVIVVVCDEPASITDAYALIKVLSQECSLNRFRILINMATGIKAGNRLFTKLVATADRFLDVSLDNLGSIPYDENQRCAVQQRRAVVEAYPSSNSARAFKKLAKLVDNWTIRDTVSGDLQFFFERLINSRQYKEQGVSA